MNLEDKGNGSFVLNLGTEPVAEDRREMQQPSVQSDAKESKIRARVRKPRPGGEPGVARMCVWFDAESARAFRTAKMVYESEIGQQTTNGEFLRSLLDGGWNSVSVSAKKIFKDFLGMKKR